MAVADVDADGDLEVLTVGSDTLVHCISHLGEKKWTHSIGDEAAGLVVLPQGIVAASLTGDLHLIDGRSNRVWRRELGSPCTALTQAGHGMCVATEAGDLVWMDAAGTPLSRWSCPPGGVPPGNPCGDLGRHARRGLSATWTSRRASPSIH